MDVFDIIGPVMIGPSSSHTAGALRIGNVAGSLLDGLPTSVKVLFSGSFAHTYKGHGTDKAVVAGILGMKTDDERIPQSLMLAQKKNVKVIFGIAEIKDSHPNTMRVILESESGKKVDLCGSSIGGGNILITEINGINMEFDGKYPAALITHRDIPGIIASITKLIACSGLNIANMKDDRIYPNGSANMLIETDKKISAKTVNELRMLPCVDSVIVLPCVY